MAAFTAPPEPVTTRSQITAPDSTCSITFDMLAPDSLFIAIPESLEASVNKAASCAFPYDPPQETTVTASARADPVSKVEKAVT